MTCRLWVDDMWIGKLEVVKFENNGNGEGTLEIQQFGVNSTDLLLSDIMQYSGGFCGAS